MHCSRCGVPVTASRELCTDCGKPVERALQPGSQVMTDHGMPLRTLYAAFIGPKKLPYYLPLFERFDRGGSSTSWNWPAALITQLWMLRRGMFLWGLILYPLLALAATLLVVMPLIIMMGDIPESWQQPLTIVTWLLLVVIMGLAGNRIFHRHVRRLIAQSGSFGLSDDGRKAWLARKGSSRVRLIVIALLLLAGLLAGMVAAIVIPT